MPGGLIKPGDIIVDCGAAPGSWTQVAMKMTGRTGQVVALDLQEFVDIPGAICLPRTDICQTTQVAQLIRKSLGEDAQGVDLVMSDIAPTASGLAQLDHPRLIKLAECVLKVASSFSLNFNAFDCRYQVLFVVFSISVVTARVSTGSKSSR